MTFRIIALAILAIFYGCYYIKLLGQKKKGIKTTQIGRGKTGFFLLEAFGEDYLKYKKTVNRYIGRKNKKGEINYGKSM